MKHTILSLLLLSSFAVICAPRPAVKIRAKVEDPLPDDVRDQQLFQEGMNVFLHIASAMFHHDDKESIQDHLAGALTGLYGFFQAVVRNPGSDPIESSSAI